MFYKVQNFTSRALGRTFVGIAFRKIEVANCRLIEANMVDWLKLHVHMFSIVISHKLYIALYISLCKSYMCSIVYRSSNVVIVHM